MQVIFSNDKGIFAKFCYLVFQGSDSLVPLPQLGFKLGNTPLVEIVLVQISPFALKISVADIIIGQMRLLT